MNQKKGKYYQVWWIAIRPFSLPASIFPVTFSTVSALFINQTNLKFGSFILALCAMMLLQAASNLINDAYDFEYGLDREVVPGSGAVVRGLISPEEAHRAGLLLLVPVTLIGIYLAWQTGLLILLCGLIGITSCLLYSIKRIGIKENSLGDLAIFVNFGLLPGIGGWILQTGKFSWYSAIWSLPLGLLIVAILHANNWRDIKSDRQHNVDTIAGHLGSRSLYYYLFLILTPFPLMAFFVIYPYLFADSFGLPFGSLLCFAVLPKAVRLASDTRRNTLDNCDTALKQLDAETAKLTVLFGVLVVAGVLVHQVFR